MELTNIGDMLKKFRQEAGLTQEVLAERSNLSVRAISDLERGLSRLPRYETLDLLTKALGLSAEQRSALFSVARPGLPGVKVREDPPKRPLPGLPVPPAAMIGRDVELAMGLEFVEEAEARLLTVTGPGGVGKTRLALALAHELRPGYADKLVWVDLAAIREPHQVPKVIAERLNLKEQPGLTPTEQLIAFLEDKPFCIFLDNFEQVLMASDFVATLLANCPQLQLVITSRSPLQLRAEQQMELAPLSQQAAVELFRERARRVQPGLNDTYGVMAEICHQLDRLPLAIELAAAHVRGLSLPMLLERLSNRLGVLHLNAQDLPQRQQTMREAIAWSYNLLPLDAQSCFRALSVFTGGCTLSAVEEVCTTAAPGSSEGLAIIEVLVNASVLVAEITPLGQVRYRMLEVIREFALEQLWASGDEEKYRYRHASYYAKLSEEAAPVRSAVGSLETLLEQEASNAYAALQWAYSQREVVIGLRLAIWLGQFWIFHGRMQEGCEWFEKLLALNSEMAENSAPPKIINRALQFAARLMMHLGRREAAETLAREGLVQAECTGDKDEIGHALATLGAVCLAIGKEEQAAIYFNRSYIVVKDSPQTGPVALTLMNLAEISRKRGELEQAKEYLEEALHRLRMLDMKWGIANTLTLLGHLAREQKDYEAAKGRYQESLALYHKLGNATYTAYCLESIATLAYTRADYSVAARLMAVAARLRLQALTPLPPLEQENYDRVTMAARAELGEAEFNRQWQSGALLSQDETFTYTEEWLSTRQD